MKFEDRRAKVSQSKKKIPLKNSIINVHKNYSGKTAQLGQRAPHCGGFQNTHTHTHTHTHTRGRTPLKEWSARRRGTQQTNIHSLGGVQTRCASNQAAWDQRLRPHGHRDRPFIRMAQNILKPPLPTSLWTKKLKLPKQIINPIWWWQPVTTARPFEVQCYFSSPTVNNMELYTMSVQCSGEFRMIRTALINWSVLLHIMCAVYEVRTGIWNI